MALKAKDGMNLFARDLAGIKRLTTQVRDQGYAYNEGHLMPGISAAAFPLIAIGRKRWSQCSRSWDVRNASIRATVRK
jgi:hypothetical protein